jgi:hypothetical protein
MITGKIRLTFEPQPCFLGTDALHKGLHLYFPHEVLRRCRRLQSTQRDCTTAGASRDLVLTTNKALLLTLLLGHGGGGRGSQSGQGPAIAILQENGICR